MHCTNFIPIMLPVVLQYFLHLFNNKKMHRTNVIPILLFFYNILYTYLIRLQTEHPNFHANSATLISV